MGLMNYSDGRADKAIAVIYLTKIIKIERIKGMEKNKKINKWILIAVAVTFVFILGLGIGSSNKGDKADTQAVVVEDTNDNDNKEDEQKSGVIEELDQEEEIEEQEPEEFEEETTESRERKPNHIYIDVGNTVGYENGIEIIPTEAGITGNYTGGDLVYVKMEIQNPLDEIVTIDSSLFSMYIDDYQVDISQGYYDMDDLYSVTDSVSINPGRKAKFDFKAKLPDDYDTANDIEVEFPGGGLVIAIKEDGVYTYGLLEPPVIKEPTPVYGIDPMRYGTYNYDRQTDPEYVLIIESAGGDYASAIVTLRADYDHQWLLYTQDSRSGYLTYMEGDEPVGSIYFGFDGSVEFENDDFPEFNGLYW